MNETAVEIGKAEEGLNVLYSPRHWPFLDNFNLGRIHGKSAWRKDKAKILDSLHVQFTLSWIQEESMLTELAEYFMDMFGVFRGIIGVYEDIVKVDDDEFIQEVGENVIYEVLEGGRCISEPEGHHAPFERAIAGVEGGLPFVTLSNAD